MDKYFEKNVAIPKDQIPIMGYAHKFIGVNTERNSFKSMCLKNLRVTIILFSVKFNCILYRNYGNSCWFL